MLTQTRWSQTDQWNPYDPTMKQHIVYTGVPGGYSTFLWKREPQITGFADAGAFGAASTAGRTVFLAVVGLMLGSIVAFAGSEALAYARGRK